MYRTELGNTHKAGAIVAAAAVNAALLLAFLQMSGRIDLAEPQSALRVFDIGQKPPPPPPPPPPAKQQQKPKEKEGGSAPKNIKSEATPVVAPKPKIETPPVQKIAATETPRQGTQPTQGAAPVRGPGTGAGGTGTGGTGTGGGGEGGAAYPPHLVTPVLTGREIGRALLDQWPRGTPVFLRLRIDAQGYVSECDVLRGTGVPAIDGIMCNLAHERLRYRPALSRSGQPVAGWTGYAQPPPR